MRTLPAPALTSSGSLVSPSKPSRSAGRWLGLLLACCAVTGARAQLTEVLEFFADGDYFVDDVRYTGTPVKQPERWDLRMEDATVLLEQDRVVIRADVNDQGSFHALVRTGTGALFGAGQSPKLLSRSVVLWEKSFRKLPGVPPPTFLVNPGRLILFDGGTAAEEEELEGYWQLTIRVNQDNQFESHVRIRGRPGSLSQADTFRIEGQAGNLFNLPDVNREPYETRMILGFDNEKQEVILSDPFYIGCEYRTPAYRGTLDLSEVADGELFRIYYILLIEARCQYTGESYAEAAIGDPLDYGSGVVMEYGGEGDLFYIESIARPEPGSVQVSYRSDDGFYYVLERREQPTQPGVAVALRLGAEGIAMLEDSSAPGGMAFYVVKKVLLTQPLDTDTDGMDDVYELNRSAFLDPLDPADADRDEDDDGFTNLAEYQNETDPTVPDGGGASSPGLYPGHLVSTGAELGGSLGVLDVNGDGRLDLVSLAGTGENAVQTLLGNPDGSYQAPWYTAVPDVVFLGGLFLGNLDADELPDAVALDPGSPKLVVLRGLGNGRFEWVGEHATGDNPGVVVIGDATGDDVVDLVVCNQNSKDVWVLPGDGNGDFGAAIVVTLPNERSPAHAAIGRLDGDAFPDLVVAGSGQVFVFPGQDGETFGPAAEYPTGFFPQFVALADLDGDLDLDLVTANKSSADISVLEGLGDGTFEPETRYATGDLPRGVRIADLDGDTFPDLVVSHAGADYHALLRNAGDGSFEPANRTYTAASADDALLLDFDGDSRLDLLTAVGGLLLAPGKADGSFETRDQVVIPLVGLVDLDIADLDGDARPDLIVANQQRRDIDSMEVLLAQANGTFGAPVSVPVTDGIQALISARLDGGVNPDVAVVTLRPTSTTRGETNSLQVFLGDGSGGFSAPVVLALPDQPWDLQAGDLNGDGSTDLGVILGGAGQFIPFLNDGQGGFTPQAALSFGGPGFHVVWVDLNGDHRSDLVAAPSFDSALKVWRANAAGGFDAPETIPLALGTSITSLRAVDLDRDGLNDVIAGLQGSGTSEIVWYHNEGGGALANAATLIQGAGGIPFAADLDADGDLDLVTGYSVYLRDAQGNYELEGDYYPGAMVPPVDLNGDEKPDLISYSDENDAVRILYHK